MTWTILILVIAAALFVFGGILLHKLSVKDSSPISVYSKKAMTAIAVVLAIVGVNRLGLGTGYYLTESNPHILQTMAQNMQQRPASASNKEVRRFIKKHREDMVRNAPVMGNVNADAKHTIFVFTVPTCPFCQRVHVELERVIADRDDVRVVVKNFSIHGIMSDDATRASIAAKLQSNDLAVALTNHLMHNKFMPEDPSKLSQEKLAETINKNIMDVAKKLGLDTERLANDMRGSVVSQELEQVREVAEKFGINGTPYLIIGDQTFPGAIPYDQIVNALR